MEKRERKRQMDKIEREKDGERLREGETVRKMEKR